MRRATSANIGAILCHLRDSSSQLSNKGVFWNGLKLVGDRICSDIHGGSPRFVLGLPPHRPHPYEDLNFLTSIRSYGGKIYPATNFRFLEEHSSPSSEQDRVDEGRPDKPDEEPLEAEIRDDSAIIRKKIMSAALKHVKKLGWTRRALQEGAKDIHLSPAAASLFDRNGLQLIEFFAQKCNDDLGALARQRAEELSAQPVSQRIKMLLRWRLEMLIPYIDNWAQALTILSRPQNAAVTVQLLADAVDEIWHAAGDVSVDYNWYTKRALLASVYATAELYMLTDYSPGFSDTWRQVDRRLEDIKKLGKASKQVQSFLSNAIETVVAAATFTKR